MTGVKKSEEKEAWYAKINVPECASSLSYDWFLAME